MDNVSLQIAFLELKDELEGRNLSCIHEPESETYLFYFSDRDKIRLLMSVRPGHPRVLLSQSFFETEKREKSPFEALLARSLEGFFVKTIEKEAGDRLIKFYFSSLTGKQAPDFILIFELIGRSSNLILTDGEEKVLGFSRKLKSEFRQPIIGSSYQLPIRPDRSIFDLLGDKALDADMSVSREKVEGFLNETLKGAPDALIGEFVERALAGRSISKVLHGILDDCTKKEAEFYIYSQSSLKALREDCVLNKWNFILSPLRIGSLGHLVENRFHTFNEAADRYFSILLRNERFASRKNSLMKHVKKNMERAATILEKLEKDRQAFENPHRFKKYAELILASMRSAKKRGSMLEVEDLFEPGTKLSIPIDPSLSLAKNADAYFRKYRRAKRGIENIEKRTDLMSAKSSRLQELRGKLAECGTFDALESIMEKMRSVGIAVGVKDRQKRSIVSDEHVSGIRIYKSSDGLQILVGKSARDNMKLTFRIATPEDFWLHASAYGGAHVVVKNASGLKRMPEKTLAEAAKLAAFYSSGKEETKIEVHHTKKKYVRKGKKLSAGTVIVKKFSSILVKPAHPFPEK